MGISYFYVKNLTFYKEEQVKKILTILLCAFAVLFACRPGDGHNHGTTTQTAQVTQAAQATQAAAPNNRAAIFRGAWCVVGEDLRIDFIGTDSVTFTSASDPSVNGNGKFSFDNTHLRAELLNSGMTMKIVYRYTITSAGMDVITDVFEVNGSPVNASPDPISLSRCR